jgi:hypothetical protein
MGWTLYAVELGFEKGTSCAMPAEMPVDISHDHMGVTKQVAGCHDPLFKNRITTGTDARRDTTPHAQSCTNCNFNNNTLWTAEIVNFAILFRPQYH